MKRCIRLVLRMRFHLTECIIVVRRLYCALRTRYYSLLSKIVLLHATKSHNIAWSIQMSTFFTVYLFLETA